MLAHPRNTKGIFRRGRLGVFPVASSPLCPVIPGGAGAMGIARTWIVTVEQARAVAALADRYGVNHSAMVRYLLGRALSGVQSGAIPIKTRPVKWELDDD